MKVLVVGPSPDRSKGGMAAVISEIRRDEKLQREFDLDIYESYIDGGMLCRAAFSVFAFLKFYFTKRNYDVYHIHAASKGSTYRKGFYVRAAKKWGKKVILHIHGAEYLVFYKKLNAKKKKKVVDILKSADLVIALSEDWRKKFQKLFGISNCVSLPNGIDTKAFADGMCDLRVHRNEFLFLGRLGERKGAYDLVDAVQIAAKRNPHIKVFMAGDGEIEKVRNLVHEKKLEKNIDVVGWVGFQEKIELLKRSATLVLPSYHEGLPMAVLEGMASGKAVISTKAGAIPEVIEEENGILIEAGDVNALAEALIKCSADADMLNKMSGKNMEKIHTQYSMEIMHRKLISYYNLLGN